MRSAEKPNSYMVQISSNWDSASGENSNFIKPRQTDKNSVSTDPLPTTGLPEIPQEPPVLQQPSSQATSTVDAIPTVPSSKQNSNSTPRQPRTSRRSTKGIPPARLGTTRMTFHVQTLLFHKGRCCDMGQNDTIGKNRIKDHISSSSWHL